MAYHYMLEQYRNSGNKVMTRKLEAAVITDSIPRGYLKIRDLAMHKLGIGTMRNMNWVVTGIFIPSLLCREYTFEEKIGMWAGKARSGVSYVWNDLISSNLNEKVPSLAIPVYFCSGIYDYTVNYSVAREYYHHLQAPVKGFYTFANSAHSPLFEEPEKMQRILKEDVLKESNFLAD
jgi:pimeloyl-ACP methyl ester carboxylesterase